MVDICYFRFCCYKKPDTRIRTKTNKAVVFLKTRNHKEKQSDFDYWGDHFRIDGFQVTYRLVGSETVNKLSNRFRSRNRNEFVTRSQASRERHLPRLHITKTPATEAPRQGCDPKDLVTPCQHNGYQDPDQCYKCICPEGFGGWWCEANQNTNGRKLSCTHCLFTCYSSKVL